MAKWESRSTKEEEPVAKEEEVVVDAPKADDPDAPNPCLPKQSAAEMRNRVTVYPPEPGAEVPGVPHTEAEARVLEKEVKAEDPTILR